MTYEDFIVKAKKAKSAEDLLALAKENDMALTEDSAKAYFEKIKKTEEIDDEELENVTGGGCHHEGKLVVSALHCCGDWTCKKCGQQYYNAVHGHRCDRETSQEKSNVIAVCESCKYCVYEDGLWLCTN